MIKPNQDFINIDSLKETCTTWSMHFSSFRIPFDDYEFALK